MYQLNMPAYILFSTLQIEILNCCQRILKKIILSFYLFYFVESADKVIWKKVDILYIINKRKLKKLNFKKNTLNKISFYFHFIK